MEDTEKKNIRKFKAHSKALVGMLVVEFILGMIANLFVVFPESASQQELWDFSMKNINVLGHIILGTLILLSAIVLLIQTIIAKNKKWMVVAVLGLVSVLVASAFGGDFIGSQSATSSFLMAMGFISALIVYAYSLFGIKE